MDFHAADRPTLERMLADPRFGEPLKDRIRARLATLPEATKEPRNSPRNSPRNNPRERQPSHTLGRMNQTEARYARDFLEPRIASGESIRYQHEKIKLRLAGGTWYTPDFFEELADGRIWVHEVKGGKVWDDAAVKFKVAAEQFPWWRWTKVQWRNGGWKVLRDHNPWNE